MTRKLTFQEPAELPEPQKIPFEVSGDLAPALADLSGYLAGLASTGLLTPNELRRVAQEALSKALGPGGEAVTPASAPQIIQVVLDSDAEPDALEIERLRELIREGGEVLRTEAGIALRVATGRLSSKGDLP